VSTAADLSAKVWEAKTGKVVEEIQHGEDLLQVVGFSPDDATLYTAIGGALCSWDLVGPRAGPESDARRRRPRQALSADEVGSLLTVQVGRLASCHSDSASPPRLVGRSPALSRQFTVLRCRSGLEHPLAEQPGCANVP